MYLIIYYKIFLNVYNMSYKIITDSFFEIFSKINYLLLTEINIKNNNFLERLTAEKKIK